ncbi:hypothetical protein G5714_004483 [Onychostoma macrolepis]|uniref:Uncharacterized protein n=1 Tax=Onychostoma macrolepis TaxID=369639 RepID=A0A7J6D4U8_9TELE|nr:hypothetical protein G5714_004483 [Onychostoma macrolepis]
MGRPHRPLRSSVVKALARRTRVACSGIDHGVGVRALLAVSPCWSEDRGRRLVKRTHEASDWSTSITGRVGPLGLADKKSFGRPTRRLSRHPTGDQDSRHRMDEPHLRAASTGAHRETSVDV